MFFEIMLLNISNLRVYKIVAWNTVCFPVECYCSVYVLRFINARRRIVQPMIDQSNRAGTSRDYFLISQFILAVCVCICHHVWS